MGLIFFILVTIITEIFIWIFVGKLVGSGWYVFFWFVAAFFIGLNLLRRSTTHIMPQMQQMQMTGQMAGDMQSSGKYMVRAIAGFLLMLPGLLTDVIAVLLLIPAVQNVFKNTAMKIMQQRQQAMMNKMMGGMGGGAAGANPFADLMRQMEEMQRGQTGGQQYGRHDSSIIDGEAREVKEEPKRINPPKE